MEMEISWQRNEQVRVRDRGGFLRYCLPGFKSLNGQKLVVDGLFAGRNWDSRPVKWNMAPFYGDWPSSVFVSQDPVAIDSVCYDFLRTEWNDYSYYDGADDYLNTTTVA